MALKEQDVVLYSTDTSGNKVIQMPITRVENVEGALKTINGVAPDGNGNAVISTTPTIVWTQDVVHEYSSSNMTWTHNYTTTVPGDVNAYFYGKADGNGITQLRILINDVEVTNSRANDGQSTSCSYSAYMPKGTKITFNKYNGKNNSDVGECKVTIVPLIFA